MKIITFFSMIICLFLFSGCNTIPDKVDLKAMPMPDYVEAEKSAGSLWPGSNGRNRYFTDFRARDVGDIITVLIVERTEAKKEASTTSGNTSNEDAAVTDLFGMPLDFKMRNFMGLGGAFSPTVKGGRTTSFSGDASTERTGEITATVSVRVMNVLPNGYLYIEGRKDTSVNKEHQYITLSGIIRPEDVSSLNTVASDSISDLKVALSGYGVVAEKQSPGWFTRILDHTWPF